MRILHLSSITVDDQNIVAATIWLQNLKTAAIVPLQKWAIMALSQKEHQQTGKKVAGNVAVEAKVAEKEENIMEDIQLLKKPMSHIGANDNKPPETVS